MEKSPDFHEDEKEFDPDTQVKIRILNTKVVEAKKQRTYEYALIHFHGGGFVCQDSSAH